jgi:hypothetical protein
MSNSLAENLGLFGKQEGTARQLLLRNRKLIGGKRKIIRRLREEGLGAWRELRALIW